MNRIHRLVWNACRCAWVAAPELARSSGRPAQRVPRVAGPVVLSLAALATLTTPGAGHAGSVADDALPTGLVVVAGDVGVARSANVLDVRQNSARAILDWNSFNVGRSAQVNYLQPDARSVALNRVTGGDPTQILGRIRANGQVFLVNANGIYFGPNAQVDAAGIVATTHDLSNADFLAGRYRFDRTGTGAVVNEGQIRIADTGIAAFVAPSVANYGVISARLGRVALGATQAFSLDLAGDRLISFVVSDPVAHTAAGLDGRALPAYVDNSGDIDAEGGQILLTAQTAQDLVHSAINQTGVLSARSVARHGGEILLLADMAHGRIDVGGTLDVSASAAADDGSPLPGGFVETSAARVKVADDARVLAQGAHGAPAGTWLIDPSDFVIGAGGDISGDALSANLAGASVSIESSSGASAGSGDIHVDEPVSWSANTLTLTAARDIVINAVMTASGSSALVLNTGTANGSDDAVAGGSVKVAFAEDGSFAGRVDFPDRSGIGFLTINGEGYTVLSGLGEPGSSTGLELQGMRGHLTGRYALGADIDASATVDWNSGRGFLPVGTSATPFSGRFEGLGHAISHLVVNRRTDDYQGLFGAIDNARIANLGLVDGRFVGYRYTGGVAGSAVDSLIAQTYCECDVSGWRHSMGGIAGYMYDSTIAGSRASGEVVIVPRGSSSNNSTGGLVGWMESGTIIDSSNAASVSGHIAVGGLAGWVDSGDIVASRNDGAIAGDDAEVGGLVGRMYAGIIDRGSNTGAVIGGDHTGGLVGYIDTGAISAGENTGAVTGANGTGGLVGYVDGGTLRNSWNAGDVTGITGAGGVIGQWSDSASLPSNTHYDIDRITINGGHRVTIGGLYHDQFEQWKTRGMLLDITDYAATLPLSSDGYHVIQSIQGLKDLLGFADVADLRFRLGASLDLSSIPNWHIPAFAAAELDGAGHTLAHLSVDQPGSEAAGLIGYAINSPKLSKLKVIDGVVRGTGVVGGLVGWMNGGSIEDSLFDGTVVAAPYGSAGGLVGEGQSLSILRSRVSGLVRSDGYYDVHGSAGGLVGYAEDSRIENSENTADVLSKQDTAGGLAGKFLGGDIVDSRNSGNVAADVPYFANAGGLVGWMRGTVVRSANVGTVTSGWIAGGLVGYGDPLTITEAHNLGTVVGHNFAGGLVGVVWQGSIERSFNAGAVTAQVDGAGGLAGQASEVAIVDAYNVGAVSVVESSIWYGAGGIVGSMYGGSALRTFSAGPLSAPAEAQVGGLIATVEEAPVVADSYWDMQRSGQAASVGGGVGLTTAQSLQAANFPGWDFATVWRNVEGQALPGLRSLVVPLRVTANDATKTYDGAPFTGDRGATMSMPAPDLLVTGAIDYGGTSQGAIQAGSYDIAPAGLVSSQFDLVFVPGTLTIGKAPLTVTANAASKAYDGAAWSGGNGVTYAGFVAGEDGSVLGGMLGYGGTSQGAVNAGSYAMTPTGLTSDNYDIVYVDGALTVGKVPLVVTAKGASRTYDGTAWRGGAGATYAGFVAGEDATVLGGTLDFGGTSQGAVNVGSYVLTPTGLASSNYDIAYVDGTLAIGKAPLTVKANDAARTYDGSAWSGGSGVTYTGFATGEDAAVLDGTLGYGGSSQGAVDAGSYAITPAGLTSGNYNISYTDGTLTVGKAALSITANSASKTYDGAAWSGGAGVTYAGFVIGEDASTLSGTLGYGGSSQGAIDAGTYLLMPGGLASPNYAIEFAGGTLTVDRAPLTVSANAAAKTYDGIPWAGGAGVTITGLVSTDDAGAITAALAWGGSSQGAANPGRYVLAPGGLATTNYVVTYLDGELRIFPIATPDAVLRFEPSAPGSTWRSGEASVSLCGNPSNLLDGTPLVPCARP